MTEGTRQQRGAGGRIGAHWRELYAGLDAEQVGRLREGIALEFRRRGLAPRSAGDYAAVAIRAERFCRERGSTVLKAPSEMFGRFASTLPLNKRARAASALRHYFAVLGRSEPDVPALRAAGSQPGRSREETEGHRLGAPHRGRGWERTESLAAIRVRRAREHMLRAGMSEATIRHYSSMLWQAERWCELRGFALVELDARTLAEYSEALSGASRRSLRSALRPYYAALEVDDPPIGAVRPPRKPRLIPKPLELFEAQQLLAAAVIDEGHRGVAVLLGMLLGLRRFEIAGLRFADFSDGWLRFVGKGQFEAALPVPRILMNAVAGLPHESPFLFPGQGGRGHTTPANVWCMVRSLSREAGLANVSTHRLRHTCLTVANDVTHDLRAVQEFARHSDPDTTAGYTRVTGERLSSIGHAVLEALSGPEIPEAEPTEPLVPLSLLALACEGPHAVAPWLELARLFFGRTGWRLSVTDDGAGIVFFEFGDDLSADVLCWTNDRPPTYCLNRWLDREAEASATWEFPDTASMAAVLGEFETGPAIPFTPSHSTLPGFAQEASV